MTNTNTTIMREIIEAAEHPAIEFQIVGIRAVGHRRTTDPETGGTVHTADFRVEFAGHVLHMTRRDEGDGNITWAAYGVPTEYTVPVWPMQEALEKSLARTA